MKPAPGLPFNALAWLLLALALVIAPHAPRLSPWIPPLGLALGAVRLLAARMHLPLPGKWLLTLLTLVAIAAVFLSYGTLFGRDAGIALLVVMLALKLLELRNLRDAMVALFLGYFLVVASFLYSQSIPTALYLLATMLVMTASWIGFHYSAEEPGPWHKFRLAGAMLLQALPLMLVLFILFPRVQGPLWGVPEETGQKATGLSDTMTPGNISRLAASNAVAFRVNFDGPMPEPALRYWRGLVLLDYDGSSWLDKNQPFAASLKFEGIGKPVKYAVTLEPHNKQWLFALDLPAALPPAASVTPAFQLLAQKPVGQRLRYEMLSFPRYRMGLELDAAERRRTRALPAGANPRTAELAALWRSSAGSDEEIIKMALSMFRSQPFFYTLNPPLLGENSVDEFLFRTRRGFCEHYASSFAVLMRAAGMPARIVLGYQGGEINPLGDYMIVRQSDAHAWVEVWLKNQGWVRVDPTAAVSPARVETGISAALPAAEAPLLLRGDYTGLRQLRLMWDMANYSWNRWVLGYGPRLQNRFLSGLGLGPVSWEKMTAGLALAGSLLLLATALYLSWRQRQREEPAQALYRAYCRKLARRGIARSPSEGPLDFYRRVRAARPDVAEQAHRISRIYSKLRYGPQPSAAKLRQLKQLVRKFRP